MKKGLRLILCITMSAIIAIAMSLPALAAVPQEDPENVVTEFSGISLYRYFSDTIDFTLNSNPEVVRARMEKMPFASVPPSISGAIDDFASSLMRVSQTAVNIDKELNELRELLLQSRLQESINLTKVILGDLFAADKDLNTAERAVIVSGSAFNIPLLLEDDRLRTSYEEVITKVGQIRELLNLYREILSNLLGSVFLSGSIDSAIDQFLSGSGDINALDQLLSELISVKSYFSTKVSLNVNPEAAFVGDDVTVFGKLQSEGNPLAHREIKLLLNGSQYVVAKTDANGYYEANVSIPYRYVSEMRIQALYLPADDDIGIYLSSMSPEFRLKVLYYEAKFTIEADPKSYPGMDTTCSGKLDYGSASPLLDRKFEAYLDDTLVAEIIATEGLSLKIKLNPDIATGAHSIVLLSSPVKRYAPVEASASINIARVLPVLAMEYPTVVIIPGRLKLAGTLKSEIGALQNASVIIGLDKASAALKSSPDGAFETDVKMDMGWGLLGSQPLEIRVTPQEPWNDTLIVSKKVLLVHVVNCGIFLVFVLFFGVLLSRRLKGQIEAYFRRRAHPVVVPVAPQEPVPVYSSTVSFSPPPAEEKEETEPRSRVLSLYISILRTMQKVTSLLLKPSQTLREFATDAQKRLGPIATPFVEFTRLTERILYSRYQVTDKEVEQSKRLASKMQEGLK